MSYECLSSVLKQYPDHVCLKIGIYKRQRSLFVKITIIDNSIEKSILLNADEFIKVFVQALHFDTRAELDGITHFAQKYYIKRNKYREFYFEHSHRGSDFALYYRRKIIERFSASRQISNNLFHLIESRWIIQTVFSYQRRLLNNEL